MNENLIKFAKSDMKRARQAASMLIAGTKRGTVAVSYDKATKRYAVATCEIDSVTLIKDGTAADTATVIAGLYVVTYED